MRDDLVQLEIPPFLIGEIKDSTVKYAIEDASHGGTVVLEITPRDWDVTDPVERELFAHRELREDYLWYRTTKSAQCWINADRNAAGLAIYRPVWPRGLKSRIG